MSTEPAKNNPQATSSGDFRFDKVAFKELFKKHYPPLCIYCKLKYSFDLYLVEDVVNSSFIKLWDTRHKLAPDISPKSYLYKIVDNLSLNLLRHEKVKQRHTDHVLRTTSEDISETTFDTIDLKQLSAAIDAAIIELPAQMRRVFELRRFEGLKYAEIASLLNISIKTVDTQMSRAMIRLREKLSAFLSFFVFFLSLFLKK
jgi:RNA polymerase sigma-70 factor (ECF subfamily)